MLLSEEEFEELKSLFIQGFQPIIKDDRDDLLSFAYWITENSTLDHDRQNYYIDTLHNYSNQELQDYISVQRLNLQDMVHHLGRFNQTFYCKKYRNE